MKPKVIKFGTHVYIEWVDSCSAYGWQSNILPSAVLVKSVAIVVGCSKKEIIVTHSLMEGEQAWNCPIAIPWIAIKTLKKYNIIRNKIIKETLK